MTITLFHNARCGKSRTVFQILSQSGKPFEVVEYLKTPLSEGEIQVLLAALALPVAEIVRKKEPLYAEKYEGKKISTKRWLTILAKNPILIERPIVRVGEKAMIVRGKEKEEALCRLLYPRLNQLYGFLEMDAKDAFTLYSIGYEYMLLSDWEKAVDYFEQLRSLHPDYTGVYYHLGKCYEKLGKPEEGMTVFEAGLAAAERKQDTHALAELKNLIQNRCLGIYDDE